MRYLIGLIMVLLLVSPAMTSEGSRLDNYKQLAHELNHWTKVEFGTKTVYDCPDIEEAEDWCSCRDQAFMCEDVDAQMALCQDEYCNLPFESCDECEGINMASMPCGESCSSMSCCLADCYQYLLNEESAWAKWLRVLVGNDGEEEIYEWCSVHIGVPAPCIPGTTQCEWPDCLPCCENFYQCIEPPECEPDWCDYNDCFVCCTDWPNCL